ncbi:hypothetical protein JYU34_004493 [Plutella xylostella]|uniref:Uncharacterized protein n=1 Tax=Plutella xylostella TaxID=51655 RepID=A0ABQ7QY55_PLUXY|nr:hypothetical protein JYU34_004493 [Plutella xylostella]
MKQVTSQTADVEPGDNLDRASRRVLSRAHTGNICLVSTDITAHILSNYAAFAIWLTGMIHSDKGPNYQPSTTKLHYVQKSNCSCLLQALNTKEAINIS